MMLITRNNKTGNGLRVRVMVSVLATTLCIVASSTASANNLACKPAIATKNAKPIAIKVVKFGYKLKSGVFDEALKNQILTKNERYTWDSQKLKHAAKGDEIVKFRFKYRDDNTGNGKPWTAAKWSQWFERTGSCTNHSTYYHEIG